MSTIEQFDAIVIGAGIAGMYQLHRLRKLGMTVRVFETGDGVGGTDGAPESVGVTVGAAEDVGDDVGRVYQILSSSQSVI